MKLTLSQSHGHRFKRAIDCDITELGSVLDYYSPAPKGNWIHNPYAPDSEETYRACYETLRGIDPNTRLTTAQFIKRALRDREADSSEIFELIKTLAKGLEDKTK